MPCDLLIPDFGRNKSAHRINKDLMASMVIWVRVNRGLMRVHSTY